MEEGREGLWEGGQGQNGDPSPYEGRELKQADLVPRPRTHTEKTQ